MTLPILFNLNKIDSYLQRILIKQAKLRPETLSQLKTKDNNAADKIYYLYRKNVLVQRKYLQ